MFLHVPHGGSRRNALREQFSSPNPRAQRVANRVHLQLAFLPVWDSSALHLNAIEWTQNSEFWIGFKMLLAIWPETMTTI